MQPGTTGTPYRVRVRGVMDEAARDAFPDVRIEAEEGDTVLLAAVVDQSALHAILHRIEALGLILVEVRPLPPPDAGRDGGAGPPPGRAARTLTKDQARRVLHRAGFPAEEVEAILAQLPDPIDTDREAATLHRLGVAPCTLVERLGGGP